MANPFCLIGQHANNFIAAIRSGQLDPATLHTLSSDARRAEFAKVVGDANAEKLNAAFEAKLLQKNQQAGIVKWIMQSTTPGSPIRRDLLARVDRMDPRILTPPQLQSFLSDLAKQKLGFRATMQETAEITRLAGDAKRAWAANDFDAYMAARVAFREYTADLEGHGPMTIPKAIVAGVRGSVLSGLTIFSKLSGAALARAVTTPLEDVVAAGVRKVVPRLAEGSPRYDVSLGTGVKAEGAAQAAAWTDGLIDAARLLRNKAALLDLAHDPNTTAHAWYEYSQSVHGALKSTTRWAEYGRSLYRRTAEAIARGENVNDMTVKFRLSTEAFKDSQRAASMQDNVLSKAFTSMTRSLSAVEKETGKPNAAGQVIATALKTDMPVTRVANNLAAEASDYIGGLLKGVPKVIYHYAHGIEDLKPVERDAIIRQISKGSIGAAIMALLYFKHDKIQFGGYYQRGEKQRGPDDVPAGGLRIYGKDVPTEFTHAPIFQVGQFAWTLGNVYGHKLHKESDPTGAWGALGAGALGVLDEVPLWGSMSRDIQQLVDPNTRADVIPGKTADLTVPGAVKWVAKQMDPEKPAIRNPKGFKQHFEANIPKLRENVPIKHKRR